MVRELGLFASALASALRKNGRLILHDWHPVFLCIDPVDLRWRDSYFTPGLWRLGEIAVAFGAPLDVTELAELPAGHERSGRREDRPAHARQLPAGRDEALIAAGGHKQPVRRVSIYIAALVVASAAGLAAPGASAAPAPSHWCGAGESAEDRLPDAVASYQVHVVYAIPVDGTDLFSQRVLPIARHLAIVDSWWRLQDSGRTSRFDLAAFPGCDSGFGALDISVVHLSQPGAAYAAGDDSAKKAMLLELAAALSSPAKKFIAFYEGPVVGA